MSPQRRQKGTGSLFKRADTGLWVGVVEVPSTDGKRHQKRVTAKNRNDCIRKLRELQKDIDAGAFAVPRGEPRPGG